MLSRRNVLLAICLLCTQAISGAEPRADQAVYVDVCVAEQDVNRVRQKVDEPLWKVLKTLPGSESISGAATHGKVQFQIQFRNGATRNDATSVEEALKRVAFTDDVEILSVFVELAQPREDGIFVGRLACIGQQRRERRR